MTTPTDNDVYEMSLYSGMMPEYAFNSLPMFTFHCNLRDRCNIRNKTLIRKVVNRKGSWSLCRSSYRLIRTTSDSVVSSDSEEESTNVVSL